MVISSIFAHTITSKKYECNTGITAEEMGKGSKRTYTSVMRSLAAMGEDVEKVRGYRDSVEHVLPLSTICSRMCV